MPTDFTDSASAKSFAGLAANTTDTGNANRFKKLEKASDWRGPFKQSWGPNNKRSEHTQYGKQAVGDGASSDGVAVPSDRDLIVAAFGTLDGQAALNLWEEFHEHFWAGNAYYDDPANRDANNQPLVHLPPCPDGPPEDQFGIYNSFAELLSNIMLHPTNRTAARHPFWDYLHGKSSRDRHAVWLRIIRTGTDAERRLALTRGRNFDDATKPARGIRTPAEVDQCIVAIEAFDLTYDDGGEKRFLELLETRLRNANDLQYLY